MVKKLRKAFWIASIRILGPLRPRWGSNLSVRVYRNAGMRFEGDPTFVASDAWFDGTNDYSLITLSEGCNISGNVQILTHDLSPYCVLAAMGRRERTPVGRRLPVRVGPHAFIGLGAILMPGCTIGRGAVVGAGSVVRGNVPDYAIAIGNPATVIADARDYVKEKFLDEWHSLNSTSSVD